MSKRTRAQLEAELKYLRRVGLASAWTTAVHAIAKWGSIAYCASALARVAEAFGGKNTAVGFFVHFLTEWRVTLSLGFGAAGIVWALRERKLRKETIERLTDRIQSLERRLDPGRSSSRLTSKGDTRPEDR